MPVASMGDDDVQRLINRAYRAYRRNLDALASSASDAVEAMLTSPGWDVDDVRELVRSYSDLASQASQDFFDQVRYVWGEFAGVELPAFDPGGLVDPDWVLWRTQGGFNSTDFHGLTFRQVKEGRSRAGVRLEDLWPDLSDPVEVVRFVRAMVRTSARATMRQAIRRDPSRPKWARVPSGAKTCAFCTMLAGREYAYNTAETAGLGRHYHPDCDCAIVPSWGKTKITGYEPERYKRMWEQARQAVGAGADYREVLEQMRRMFPDGLTDGVRELSKPWPKDVKQISQRTWVHILDGDPNGKGGHAPWASNPGKSHFPDDWDEKKIKWAIRETIVNADTLVQKGKGFQRRYKTIETVLICVNLTRTKNGFRVLTAFPEVPNKRGIIHG